MNEVCYFALHFQQIDRIFYSISVIISLKFDQKSSFFVVVDVSLCVFTNMSTKTFYIQQYDPHSFLQTSFLRTSAETYIN